jgi:uncharacterized protein (DUF58 family)
MYLGLVLVVVAVFCVIAGIVSGGVFTIVLVPLAVIAVVAGAAALVSARAAGISGTLVQQPGPLPRGRVERDAGPPLGEVPATPDDYVDARQRSQ